MTGILSELKNIVIDHIPDQEYHPLLLKAIPECYHENIPKALEISKKYPHKLEISVFMDERISWKGDRMAEGVKFLEDNWATVQDQICWLGLSYIPEAIHILEKNQDEIRWEALSENSAAVHLLEANPDK
jgi:hypothetical protein